MRREEERSGYEMRVRRNERRECCSDFGRHARVQAAMGAQFLWSTVIFHFVPRELVGVVRERVLPPGGRPVRLVDDVRLASEERLQRVDNNRNVFFVDVRVLAALLVLKIVVDSAPRCFEGLADVLGRVDHHAELEEALSAAHRAQRASCIEAGTDRALLAAELSSVEAEAADKGYELLDDSPRGMLSSKLLVAPGEPGGSEEEGSGASTAAGPTVQAARGAEASSQPIAQPTQPLALPP